MDSTPALLPIAKAKTEIGIIPKMANRHGLIAGATGTGKTVTLRVMAEQFSSIGVPVFMADVKGDLSGLPFPGGGNPKVTERLKQSGLPASASRATRWSSGMYSENRAIPSGRPPWRWGPCS